MIRYDGQTTRAAGRLGSWQVWETTLGRLRQAWLGAPPERRLVLVDGRPAVLSEDRQSVTTIAQPLWQIVRRTIQDRPWWHVGTPRRTRQCASCGSLLQVVREYEQAWTFRCPTCRSVEVHGKDRVGGTIGAGERERT